MYGTAAEERYFFLLIHDVELSTEGGRNNRAMSPPRYVLRILVHFFIGYRDSFFRLHNRYKFRSIGTSDTMSNTTRAPCALPAPTCELHRWCWSSFVVSAITVRTRHEFLRTSLLFFPIKALACFLSYFIAIFVASPYL